MTAKALFANNAKGKLNANITNIATVLALQGGQGALFPNPTAGDWFMFTIIDQSGNIEVCKCTQRTTDSFDVIVRGQEGTTNRAFSTNDRVELRWTKGTAEAMQQRTDIQAGTPLFFGIAGGTADALTATLASDMTALVNGMVVRGQAASANTLTNPTLNLTLGSTATGAKTIAKGSNVALAAGDIPGADAPIEVQYDSSIDKWVLLNPYAPVTAPDSTKWGGATKTVTTGAPSGGVDGDIHFRYAP